MDASDYAENKVLDILERGKGAVEREMTKAQKKSKSKMASAVDKRSKSSYQQKAYMIQDFITGEDLYKYLKKSKDLSTAEKILIGLKCAECLERLHRLNIIHGDVAPRNFMIDDNGNSKIIKDIDFGTSIQLDPSETERILSFEETHGFPSGAVGFPDFYDEVEDKFKFDKGYDIYQLAVFVFEQGLGMTEDELTILKEMKAEKSSARPSASEVMVALQDKLKTLNVQVHTDTLSLAENQAITQVTLDDLTQLSETMISGSSADAQNLPDFADKADLNQEIAILLAAAAEQSSALEQKAKDKVLASSSQSLTTSYQQQLSQKEASADDSVKPSPKRPKM